MKRACSKNDILVINGILGVYCDRDNYFIDPATTQNIENEIELGNLFLVLSDKKLALTAAFVEAQTGTSADGTVYETAPAYEGYTAEFPPTLIYTKKITAIKDHCDKCYLVNKEGENYIIYGERRKVAGNWVLYPFDFNDVTVNLPNGRFGGGSNLPVNNITFVMNELDDITYSIGSIEVPIDQMQEFNIAFMNVNGGTISFYDDSDTNIDLSVKIKIDISSSTTVDMSEFEFSGTYEPTSMAVTDGSIVLTPEPTAGTRITQVHLIDGIMSLNTVTV